MVENLSMVIASVGMGIGLDLEVGKRHRELSELVVMLCILIGA